ncbi:universal stress protein [Sulfitobacter sp. F26204]|uniref:universal stress protein n=1 Tax=Sulfitobacter sp. F26204 TaxID=2996014 RepID=UPI00225DF4E7|nr:universal stress protein [Sulfitobacter sp. F26204]MCX7561196.1 universal stress protein [Sulfitobacter sp. F26204]
MTQKTILAAVGQLPLDIDVLGRALALATTSKARLTVVHVLDLPGELGELENIQTLLGQAAYAARDRIALSLADLGAAPNAYDILIRLGSHAIALIDICHEISPDLIVMRAHQRGKIKEPRLGSTTDRVIAAAGTPVLVVKQGFRKPCEKVIVATNGTDQALEASACVFALFPKARTKLVQVVQIPPQLKEAMLRVGSRQDDLKTLRKKLVAEAKTSLRATAAKVGPQLKPKVYKGDPAKVLTRLCHVNNVDMIVLGQGHASLVRRAFIGSVSRRLLRDAVCDVLIWCPKTPTNT